MSNITERLARLESEHLPAEVLNRPDGFYETWGQLEAMLPPGAIPAMPIDSAAKPDMSHLMETVDGKRPKPPSILDRQRPPM